MIPRLLVLAMASLLLLTSAGCAGLSADRAGPLPFKVAVVPLELSVLSGPADQKDAGDELQTRFDAEGVIASIRDALGGQFADAVVLAPPAGVSLDEFRRSPKREQDAWWIRSCVEQQADLLLECDVKLPGRAHCTHNEEFWLNLPLFLLGGPFCWFVNDTTYEGEARLVASLHQVLPIQGGRATLGNGRAEVARFDVRFNGVRLDFLDRAETWSYPASLICPPGLLAMDNPRVRERFATEVGRGLAAGLARQVDESAHSILKTESLADFYLMSDVRALAAGGEVRVEGSVVVRGESAEMREVAILCGPSRVNGTLEAGRRDPFLSTDRESVLRSRFSKTIPREKGIDRIRIELIQGGRERIARTFTVPVTNVASRGD